MKWVLLLLAVLTGAPARQAETPIIGLLALPEVFGADVPCADFVPKDIPLYATPGFSGILATLHADKPTPGIDCVVSPVRVRRADGRLDDLPTKEHAYEAPAAIVLEERRGWFRIRLADGAAWLRASPRDEFHPLERLLEDGVAHLTEAWDGHLAPSPGSATRTRVPTDPRRRIIGYVTPVLEEVSVVLQPGEDREEVYKRYNVTAMGSYPGPNGTRILHFSRGKSVEAFEAPDRKAPVAARFETDRCDSALRSVHGVPQEVLVFDRRPGWFQVALRGEEWQDERRVWIEDAPVWRFETITDERERERFATDAWGREHSDVRVLGSRRFDGRLWVRVEVMSHSVCASIDDPTVKARGWMPAHAPGGEPAIWFSSRGC
jgi:hypothetical protein